jgi:hypothetical protein
LTSAQQTFSRARRARPASRERSTRGRGTLFTILLIVAAALILNAIERLPANYKPWRTPHLAERPTSFANLELNVLAHAPKMCLAALNQAAIAYTEVPEQPMTNGCGVENGVRVSRLTAKFSSSIESTCALTAALTWWEKALDADAMATVGAHILRVDHAGTYACRNVNNEVDGPRSEHATANAIDVTGFRFADGTRATVAKDWNKPTPAGKFLALAHADACRFFNAVLSPDYNALHHDHFHLDLGFWHACR